MKIVGLITEYNPFHNGHLYHINKAKELTGADTVVVVMSGNFVQRGTPAMMPKHLRAQAALEAGASLVIELPVCYATGSAEYFAMGAVSLLHNLGCIDDICFGSECGDLQKLSEIAQVLIDEPSDYKDCLQKELKTGTAFPLARKLALSHYLKDDEISDLLDHPNNILGVEYLKALQVLNSSIKPCTLKRKVSSYHDRTLTEYYSSASAIRTFIKDIPSSERLLALEQQMPASCMEIVKDTYGIRYPVESNDFSLLLKTKLLRESRETLTQYLDINEELANRILNNRNDFISFDQFCDLLKNKSVTYTRISRALLHILLGVYTSDVTDYASSGYCLYAHVLGFKKMDADILSIIKERASIPIISKLTQTEELSPSALHMLDTDIFASNLYESVITDKFHQTFIHELSQSLVMI